MVAAEPKKKKKKQHFRFKKKSLLSLQGEHLTVNSTYRPRQPRKRAKLAQIKIFPSDGQTLSAIRQSIELRLSNLVQKRERRPWRIDYDSQIGVTHDFDKYKNFQKR